MTTRARVLQGSIVTSHSLSLCSEGAALTFVHLMLHADDYGRIDGRIPLLHGHICSVRSGLSIGKLEKRLAELADELVILCYDHDGRPYIQIVHWERDRWAGRRAKKSKFPCPRGEFGPFEPSSEILGPCRKEILGDPRSGSGYRVAGSGERGEGKAAEEPLGKAQPFPDVFPVQHSDALVEWWYSNQTGGPGRCFAPGRDPMDVLQGEVAHAIEVVKDWARAKNARKHDWVATIRNAMRDGWALKGFNGGDPSSPTDAKADRSRQAARDVMDES